MNQALQGAFLRETQGKEDQGDWKLGVQGEDGEGDLQQQRCGLSLVDLSLGEWAAGTEWAQVQPGGRQSSRGLSSWCPGEQSHWEM